MEKITSAPNIQDLLGSNYIELLKLRPLTLPLSLEDCYAKIMCAYYQNNSKKLDAIFKKIETLDTLEEKEFLLDFILFRKSIVEGTLNLEQIIDFSEKRSNIWRGEILFCSALAAYKIKQFEFAKKLFLKSSIELKKQKIFQKSLLAKINAITMEGNIDSRNKLIANYLGYIKECQKAKAIDTIANAYLNVSDEYYKMGAFYTAYFYCEKSLDYLKNQTETHQYFESIALKIEILCAIERKKEALVLMENLRKDQGYEFIEALKVIEYRHFNGSKEDIDKDKLSPPWKVKLLKYKNIKMMGKLEDEVLRLLGPGELELDHLQNQIYPDIDSGDAYNRLTTLFSRINKKNPGLIITSENTGKYKLSFNDPIEENSK